LACPQNPWSAWQNQEMAWCRTPHPRSAFPPRNHEFKQLIRYLGHGPDLLNCQSVETSSQSAICASRYISEPVEEAFTASDSDILNGRDPRKAFRASACDKRPSTLKPPRLTMPPP
jgi:hypothetical protein